MDTIGRLEENVMETRYVGVTEDEGDGQDEEET